MKKGFIGQIFYYSFVNNFSATLYKINFLTSAIELVFSDFCYITKYWNSDRIKLSALGVCCMCKTFLKESCKWYGFSVQGLYALCSTVIRTVCVASNMNSTESKLKKFRKKNVGVILFYPFLPRVINRDIFITPLHLLEPHVVHGRPLFNFDRINYTKKGTLALPPYHISIRSTE